MKERNLRKTNIVCTIGPAVENRMDELMKAGMSIARINFSHGDFEEQKDKIERFFEIRKELGLPVAIMLDTKRPEIRTALNKAGRDVKVQLKEGQKFKTPLYKFDLKQDIKVAGVDDPTLNENYIIGLEFLTKEQFEKAKAILAKVGEIIRKDLERKSIKLIDMKMEMGFAQNGDIIVIDEISQDCIRANDMQTGKSLTKDAFRQLKSDEEVLECYKEFNRRLRNLEDIYEYIRDNNSITKEMSNTKRIIQELIKKEQSAIDFCNKKIEEEKQEIEEAKVGKHFHDDMTKRKILVNEISQYIYWKTIVAVSNYKYFNIEKEIVKILKDIDITKIGEKEPITVEEIIQHEIEKMKEKEYLKEVI